MNLNPYDLQRFARKEHSQFGEDGITLELVRRIQPSPFAIEIGCGSMDRPGGIENNTMCLVERGWSVVWYEPRPGTSPPPPGVILHPRAVTYATVPEGWCSVLSIDVDGNDYWLWEACGAMASIVIIEFLGQYSLDDPYVSPYDEDYVWDNKDQTHGASLFSMIELGKELGYEFVCTTTACPSADSPNAFFVRNDLLGRLHEFE